MAFTAANFISMNTSNTNAGDIWQYKEATATVAQMSADDYFNTAAATYGLKDGDAIYLIGSDGVGIVTMTITSGAADVDKSSVATIATTPQVVITASTYVPTAAQSGTTFILARAAGVAVTLPANAVGLKYTFIHGTPVLVSANSHTIVTNASDNTICGSVVHGGVIELAAACDLITMPHTVSILGDTVTLESDATYWYLSGMGSTDDSILPTQAS